MLPQEVSNSDVVFSGDVSRLMPNMDDIPDEFNCWDNKWVKLAGDWFYSGIKKDKLGKPKPGIDRDKAIRHLSVIMNSFQPKHEDKLVAVGYLMSQWFEG